LRSRRKVRAKVPAFQRRTMTTPEEQEKSNQLCKQIQSETDPALQELDELLEKRESLFREDQRKNPLL
jgi:Tfp pilus assembly protein PilN